MDWYTLLERPRLRVSSLEIGSVPNTPGLDVWMRDGEVVYLGSTSNLRGRVRTHLSTSLDLSRSALRRHVGELLLGIPHSALRDRVAPPAGAHDVDVVASWLADCSLGWLECGSRMEARGTKVELLEMWLPVLQRKASSSMDEADVHKRTRMPVES
ncbi:hypothetical protein GCM10009846_26560 [Agrococcus versicolor]|uniref:GIY-YIG domain-containing protein n=1 Tax=Agrococcus versicolor TaxID=501482 RepID=A0ABP5MNV9_9MICO